jgi:hypothetical protein
MLERQHLLMDRDDGDNAMAYSTDVPDVPTLVNFATSNHSIHPSSSSTAHYSHPLSPSSALHRRRYSFLQYLAVDDVLLRVFEFIDCSSLVRTSSTCHRFCALTVRSAEQRTQRLADGRLLRSSMKMLRAQEQIEGVGEAGPFVPIPMLGLPRRVRVTGAGDAEYNGTYFCTGSNGNGFLFTKPRSSEARVRSRTVPTFNMQQLLEMDVAGGLQEVHPIGAEVHPIGAGPGDANINGLDVLPFGAEEDNAGHGDGEAGGTNGQGIDAVDVLFGNDRSRLLRCVISKRFSNEVCQLK